MDINGKVIVVTGASAGIGTETAKLLASEGARVALIARSEDKLAVLVEQLPGSMAVVADLNDEDEVKRSLNEVHDHFGRIDALVNNAGVGLYGAVENIDLDAYKKMWALNVVAPLVALQHVAPLMRAQGGGSIVNVSSMVSKSYIPFLGGYASSKYALNGLMLTARQELAAAKIIVSQVYPSLTDTDFGKNAYKSDIAAKAMESRNRVGMPGADSPEFVATRILFALTSGEPEVYMHQ